MRTFNWVGEEGELQNLLFARSRLETGVIQMDWHLMLRVMTSFMPVFHGWTAELSTYERANQWREEWLERATPQWVEALCDLIIDPPLQLIPSASSYVPHLEENFKEMFAEMSRRFPDPVAEAVIVLLSDSSTRLRTLELIFEEYTSYL